jgi:hypothetical protein
MTIDCCSEIVWFTIFFLAWITSGILSYAVWFRYGAYRAFMRRQNSWRLTQQEWGKDFAQFFYPFSFIILSFAVYLYLIETAVFYLRN